MLCSKMFTDAIIKFPNKEIKTCCKTHSFDVPTNLITPTFLLTSEELVARKKFMVEQDGFPTPSCQSCITNKYYLHRNEWQNVVPAPGLVTDDHINFYEFSFSTACDLKCIYCAPKDSASWAKQLKLPEIKEDDEWTKKTTEMLLHHLKNKVYDKKKKCVFNFLGGEPTYTLKTIEFIEQIIDIASAGKISIWITTNGNTKSTIFQRYLKLFEKYPTVHWRYACSIDGIGDQAMAIRQGLKWNTFLSNLAKVTKYPNVDVLISPTVNPYSLPTFVDFIKFFEKFFEQHDTSRYAFSENSSTEQGMNIGCLPEEYKRYAEEVIAYCSSQDRKDRYKRVISNFEIHKNQIGTRLTHIEYINLKYKYEYFKLNYSEHNWDKLFPHILQVIDYYEKDLKFVYNVKNISIKNPDSGLQELTVELL